MMKKMVMLSLAAGTLAFSIGVAAAADPNPAQQQIQAQEQIYGSQIMTQQERDAFRMKMRGAKTPEEREQIRLEHHEKMKKIAKERGLTLPDEPPAQGGGMGPGGMGPGGMGPGGMGPGGGRNR
jgi:hypothetical protein